MLEPDAAANEAPAVASRGGLGARSAAPLKWRVVSPHRQELRSSWVVELRRQTLTGQTVLLNNTDMHVLGPRLVLNDCVVACDSVAKGLTVVGLRMNGGRFVQTRRLCNKQFAYGHFHGVAFEGTFSGCDFGSWDGTEDASLSSCDFSKAILDGVRFLNVDPAGTTFPPWPGVIITNPIAALDAVRERTWPTQSLRISMEVACDNDPECTVIALRLDDLAKRGLISIDACADLIRDLPGVALGGVGESASLGR